MSLRIAQLSDLHVDLRPGARLFDRRAVDTLDAVLAALPDDLDAVLLTGDLTDLADEPSTAHVHARISELGLPTRWLAGNHDDPAVLARVAAEWMAPLELGRWTVIPVQTFVGGQWFGRITQDEYARLDRLIATACGHVLLALHQPPIGICSAPGCILEDAPAFFDFIDARPAVRAVVSGHQHRAFQHSRNGVLLAGAGSSCAQVDHVGDGFAQRADPPGAQVIALEDDGSCRVSHLNPAASA